MTDEEVTAVHDQVMALIRQRKWIRAAELADTVSELPNAHPWNPTERHWGLCLRRIASANPDSSTQQPGIERLQSKIQQLGHADEKQWWKRWN